MEEGTCTCDRVVPSLEVGDHSDSHFSVYAKNWTSLAHPGE